MDKNNVRIRLQTARTTRWFNVLGVRTEEAAKATKALGDAFRKKCPWWARLYLLMGRGE